MADIKDQLIKDSYNYVLQSDISTGVVYRIGGAIPVNPIFSSGITINDSFTYSNGTEQNGYALLTDGTGYAYWGPVSGSSPSSGVTSITVGNGLSASSSTGAVTIVFTGSTGASGDYLPLSGGTVYGNTYFTSGLTANTLNVTGNTILANTSGTSFYTNYIDFNNTLSPLPSDVEGRMYWDEDNGTVSLGMHGGQVVQQIGLEQYYYIKNQSGATIQNGRVVRADGTLGSSGRILGKYMIANGTIPAKYTLGIATEDIIDGDDGYVTEFGLVRAIDTTGSLYGETWVDGDILWVSPTIAGGLTKFEPQSPYLKIEIAIVVRAHSNGSLFVRPNRHPYMYDIQQVNYSAGTETNYDILQWSGSSWNKTNTPFFNGLTATTISATTYQNLPISGVTNGTGISTSITNGNLTITNTSPNQTVTITGGTNIQIVSSYPNFGVNFTGGTILKYFVSGSTPSGVSLNDGDRWFDTNSGIEVVWITDNDGSQWIQPFQGGGGSASGDYLPLSGGTVTGGTIFQSGLTSNTISATTYQNLPISGVTNGTGISTSITNGNVTITNTAPDQTVTINSGTDISVSGTYPDFTIDYTGTGGGGTTLIASNSCIIPADDITYYGATIGGWGFFNWDVNVKSTINPSLVNLGIPLPENLAEGDTISVCGIAFSDATEPDSDNFDVRLDFFKCTNYSIIPLGNVSYFYGTDGVVCFNLYIELNINLSACDTFLLLGFESTTSDATQIKISYSIKTPGTNR